MREGKKGSLSSREGIDLFPPPSLGASEMNHLLNQEKESWIGVRLSVRDQERLRARNERDRRLALKSMLIGAADGFC